MKSNQQKPIDKQLEKIVEILIDKIKSCRWGKGIRDKEKYELLKENIRIHGIQDALKVWPIGSGEYEVFIGDHRLNILKEFKWKTAPCIIKELTEEQAFFQMLANNINRQNYGSEEQEEKIVMAHNYDKSKSKAQLGRELGLTGQRIGQLITAYKDRQELLKANKSKAPFKPSTEAILDSRPLKNISERLAFLKLVEKKKISLGDAKHLSTMDEETRQKILSGKNTYAQYKAHYQNQINKAIKQKQTKTIRVDEPRFAEHIYKKISENLSKYMMTLDDNAKAVDYLKMTIAVISEILSYYNEITDEQFKHIRDNILEINRDKLDDYDGKPLDQNIGKYLGKTKDKDFYDELCI